MLTALLFTLLQSAPTLDTVIKLSAPPPVPTAARIAATPLSADLPADITRPEGAPSYEKVLEFALAPDTAAVLPSGSFAGLSDMAGLSLPPAEAGRYFRGIVRSGTEDIRLCAPRTPCPVTVRFRFTQWEARYEPVPGSDWGQKRQTAKGLILVQATFTTQSTWNEIVYTDQDNEEKGWLKTSTGWRSVGVLEHLLRAVPVGYRQDTMPRISEKARDAFRKLLACTQVMDRCTTY